MQQKCILFETVIPETLYISLQVSVLVLVLEVFM